MAAVDRNDQTLQPGLTARLATYAAGVAGIALPEPVLEQARHHVLDTLAAIVSGARLPAGVAARAYVTGEGGHPEATVVGAGGLRTSAVHAALANAMAAHADETDDAHPASLTHPGCAVVPAALAMAQRQGASGAELLRAIVLGYDVCARIGVMLGAASFLTDRDFDTHAFGGVFGAAAAAGALLTQQPLHMAHVLSYAAQQASGLTTLFRDPDHIEKAFVFAGMPARNGVAAATMVGAGLSGVADVLDGRPSFLSAFGVAAAAADVFDDLGRAFAIGETNIKRWSVGSPIQAVLDAIEVLRATHAFAPAEVAAVEVELSRSGAKVVDNRDMPSVNCQHLVALMLLDGTVGFAASHDVARMADPAAVALAARVRLVATEAMTRAETARQAVVTVTLHDGRRLRHHTEAVRGTLANPMTGREVAAKARDLMAPVLGAERTQAVIAAVADLDSAAGVAHLAALLQG